MKLTHLSPVEYCSIKTQINQFIHEWSGLRTHKLKVELIKLQWKVWKVQIKKVRLGNEIMK
jgi:hypothetical protein